MNAAELVADPVPGETANKFAIAFVAFAGVAWLLGAALETLLVLMGVRLTHPTDQAIDYDDFKGQPPA